MCFLFFHKWGAWSEAYKVNLWFTDEIGNRLTDKPLLCNMQRRKCLRCNKIGERRID